MAKYLAIIAALFALPGCAKIPLERKAEVRTTQLTWLKETPTTCGKARGHINACATNASDYSWCVIRMPENTPDSTIGEEFRHCFGEDHFK